MHTARRGTSSTRTMLPPRIVPGPRRRSRPRCPGTAPADGRTTRAVWPLPARPSRRAPRLPGVSRPTAHRASPRDAGSAAAVALPDRSHPSIHGVVCASFPASHARSMRSLIRQVPASSGGHPWISAPEAGTNAAPPHPRLEAVPVNTRMPASAASRRYRCGIPHRCWCVGSDKPQIFRKDRDASSAFCWTPGNDAVQQVMQFLRRKPLTPLRMGRGGYRGIIRGRLVSCAAGLSGFSGPSASRAR